MTVILQTPFKGQNPGTEYTGPEEAMLVSNGLATLIGGVDNDKALSILRGGGSASDKAAFAGAAREAFVASNLLNVAARCRLPDTISAGNAQMMSRRAYPIRTAFSALQLVFPNIYLSTAAPWENDALARTITAAVEYPAGVFTRVTFGGATSTLLGAGLAQILPDQVAVSGPAGALVIVHTWQSAATGGVIYSASAMSSTALGDGCTLGASVTDSTGSAWTPAAPGGPTYGPSAILAVAREASVAIVSDSRGYGAGNLSGATSYAGEIEPALGPVFATMNLGISSFTAQAAASGGFTKRATYLQYANAAVLNLGINDVTANRTAAQILGDRDTIRALAPTLKWFETTMGPRSPSSNTAWTSYDQDIISQDPARIAVNEAVRAGRAGYAGLFDLADAFESARNSGRWSLPELSRQVSDAAITSGQTTATSATGQFAPGDIGNAVTIAGAGAAGAVLKTQIVEVFNPTSARVSIAASTTVTGAAMRVGSLTADGVHANPTGYARVTRVIDPRRIRDAVLAL